MNFSPLINNSMKIRNAILLGAKLVSLIICIYLMIHYSEYRIQWNLFSYFFPKITQHIDNLLSFFSTIILVIPFCVVVLSILIPDNNKLRIISGLIAVTTCTVSVIKGFWNNTVGQAYDFGLVVITHVATLEQKQQVFLLEFKRVALEISKNIKKKLTFINDNLSPTDFVIYDNNLRGLDTFEAVKKYAFDVVVELNIKYDKLHQSKPFNITDYVSIKTIFIGSVIVVGTIALFYYFSEPDNAKKIVKAARDIASDNVDQTKVITKNAENIQSLTQAASATVNTTAQTAALATTNFTEIAHIKNELVKAGINDNYLYNKIQELLTRVSVIESELNLTSLT